ncbi:MULTISPECIES: DUF6339 family protein [unclassified Wenzhouxiangella]|uniref:DUF6339 family protein n=1 Tax=unclassified Wenzhouxiangella TaxID=2613841 RepID=UPI0011C07AC7|nr:MULTISPECIES: DUF6339 family protein [unclassified Wenzhouxiangella]
MKLRICKTSVVEELRSRVPDNLDKYRSGDFSFLETDTSSFIQLDIDVDEEAISNLLTTLDAPVDDYQSEVRSAISVFNAMSSVSPYLARDERMWVYLAHTSGLEYSRQRWPIPEDEEKAVKYIRTHFFAATARQIERDNAISRLWWVAYLCSRVESVSLQKALEAFLYRADVRANIVERPTTSQSLRTFDAVVTRLSESLQTGKELFDREQFRQSMVELNLLGGIKLLEALPSSQLNDMLSTILPKKNLQ